MLVDALLEAYRRTPRMLAVDDGVRVLSFQQLTLFSAVFRDVVLHETSCPRVGVMLPASTVFPAVLFGLLWGGRTVVPLNFLLKTPELARVVEDAQIDLILTIAHFRDLAAQLPARTLMLEDLPLKRRIILARFKRLPAVPTPDTNDTAVILYTSGTTAEPKGVELTYRNLHSNCVDAIASLEIDPRQSFLNTLPPFHVFGLTANVLIPVFLGGAVYSLPRFNALHAVRTIAQKRVTIVLAIPSMFAAMLRTRSTHADAFRSVYLAISGGEPLPDSVRTGFAERFGVTLRQGYGLTETSPVVSACSVRVHRDGTVGKPLRNVTLRIVGPDHREVPIGEDGEILVRGPNVMKGYYRKPAETRAVIDPEGWFSTGDIGRWDADGFLRITGRCKDMLIVGGENVYAREIEAVLEAHQGVLQAAVIGAPDPLRGEVPVGFIIPRPGASPTEEQLRVFAKGKLAGFKVPRRILIREELPAGPTGKILKRKLRELL